MFRPLSKKESRACGGAEIGPCEKEPTVGNEDRREEGVGIRKQLMSAKARRMAWTEK